METLQEAYETIPKDDFSFDEDIREIFIDEAVEVLQEMDINLPKWTEDPYDFTPLTEIRRGFHTLKGSGRMVGAFAVGETAWSVESLLNRVLDKKVAVSDELVSFVHEAKHLIPYLVNDFANAQPPTTSLASIILKAENLRLKKDINTGLDTDSKPHSDIHNTAADAEVKATSRQAPVAVDITDSLVDSETIIAKNNESNASEFTADINQSDSNDGPAVAEETGTNNPSKHRSSKDSQIIEKINPVRSKDSSYANEGFDSNIHSISSQTDSKHNYSNDLAENHKLDADSDISISDNGENQISENNPTSKTSNKTLFFIGISIVLLILLFILL